EIFRVIGIGAAERAIPRERHGPKGPWARECERLDDAWDPNPVTVDSDGLFYTSAYFERYIDLFDLSRQLDRAADEHVHSGLEGREVRLHKWTRLARFSGEHIGLDELLDSRREAGSSVGLPDKRRLDDDRVELGAFGVEARNLSYGVGRAIRE